MRRGEWPNLWVWEVFHGGRPLKDRIWGGYFKSESEALAAGQPALDKILRRTAREAVSTP
jgi:hypothetical protein